MTREIKWVCPHCHSAQTDEWDMFIPPFCGSCWRDVEWHEIAWDVGFSDAYEGRKSDNPFTLYDGRRYVDGYLAGMIADVKENDQ